MIIYFISSPQTDKIYFGSTTHKAHIRFGKHKCSYKRWTEGKKQNNTTSFEIIQFSDAVLTVLEEVEDKEDMLIGEEFYIRNFPCVNKCIPNRPFAEYSKVWRDKNKEEIKRKRRAKRLLNLNLVPVMEQPLTVGINE
jgi:hypothetical protein